jgi:hypothetical protein
LPPQAFGGGAAESTITVPSLILIALSLAFILFGNPKRVSAAALLTLILIPAGNVIVIGGLHLMPARIIAVLGCGRLAVSQELSFKLNQLPFEWNSLDSVYVAWALSASIFTILLWHTSGALALECARLSTSLGIYFLFRVVIRDEQDVEASIKTLAIASLIIALEMVYEHAYRQNLFGSLLGGVETSPLIRAGNVRAQGPFRHSISAGVFGATLVPLILWLKTRGKSPWLMTAGVISCTAMVVMSASSTPVGSYAGAIAALAFWPIRASMRIVRWGIVGGILALNAVMKAPVWYAIAHVGIVSGSTASFRAELINGFVQHFSEWWLSGVKSTYEWGPSMWDLSNEFVRQGIGGGIVTVILFIGIITTSYSRIGTARKRAIGEPRREWRMWLLGCAMFAHINAFFGVSYWDAVQFAWIAFLVMISAATHKQQHSDPISRASIEGWWLQEHAVAVD